MKKSEKEAIKQSVLYQIQTAIDMFIRMGRYDKVQDMESKRTKFLLEFNK